MARIGAYNTLFISRHHPPHFRSLRLVAQDTALSRREQGFETPRERHKIQALARVETVPDLRTSLGNHAISFSLASFTW